MDVNVPLGDLPAPGRNLLTLKPSRRPSRHCATAIVKIDRVMLQELLLLKMSSRKLKDWTVQA
jgi:hypothetical protein